jgi:hypothetical protein
MKRTRPESDFSEKCQKKRKKITSLLNRWKLPAPSLAAERNAGTVLPWDVLIRIADLGGTENMANVCRTFRDRLLHRRRQARVMCQLLQRTMRLRDQLDNWDEFMLCVIPLATIMHSPIWNDALRIAWEHMSSTISYRYESVSCHDLLCTHGHESECPGSYRVWTSGWSSVFRVLDKYIRPEARKKLVRWL